MPEKGKIGIITLYYKSRNFGGILQAYALCRYLRGMGYDAEQICYLMKQPPPPPPLKTRLKRLTLKKVIRKILLGPIRFRLERRLQARNAAMDLFAQEMIPHSGKVYSAETVKDCQDYAAYITGSDQVWNLDWYEPALFLEFVQTGKKLAYAASLGRGELTESQACFFRERLSGFSAVSVREKDAVDLLSPLSPVPVEWVLDPVLLLTREQWDEVCEERKIARPYLFCYFLGDDKTSRRLAKEFARKHALALVCLPYLRGVFLKYDLAFGDVRLYDVAPGGFLSLIKYADYVFTDSFHAIVFSELYGTEYAVFRRDGTSAMASRLYSLTSIFESRERFCDTDEKETLDYIESLEPMGLERPPMLNSMREYSYRFLKENLVLLE